MELEVAKYNTESEKFHLGNKGKIKHLDRT